MSPELARRLARRAKRRQHNGFRGWLARAAWDRLVRAADDGDGHAIDAAWRLWQEDHDTDVLACLPRWWPSSVLRVHVLRYAVDPRRPVGSRAVLGALCTENGLVPADPVDRVRFFALTAQPERHHALDPDGTLLTIAYRTADQATRKALRGAMTAAGDLDVVKVIAGGEPSGDEIAYLTRHLAATGQWPALWRLVRDMPLPYAAASVNLLRDWEPHAPAERHVFERLMAIGANTVAEAARTLDGLRVMPISSKAVAVSFAPGRSGLAVAMPGGGIERYTLPGMVSLGTVGLRPRLATRALHLGESIVAVETGAGGVDRLVRYRTGSEGGENAWTSGSRHDGVWALAGARGRFFAAKSGELLLGTATTLRRVTRHELGLPAVFAFPVVLAAEPATGRLAIGGRRGLDLSILSANLRLIAHRRDETGSGVRDVVFVGRDRLVTVDVHGWVMRWRRAGNTLRLDQSVQVPLGSGAADDRPSLCAMPARGRFAVVGFDRVTWLDADTFAVVEPPAGSRNGVDRLWASPDGHLLAVRYRDGRTELHNLLLGDVADLLDRPMSNMTPGSVATVRTAQRGHLDPGVGRTLALLRACLAHGFDTEISLGATTRVRTADDDIALGGVT